MPWIALQAEGATPCKNCGALFRLKEGKHIFGLTAVLLFIVFILRDRFHWNGWVAITVVVVVFLLVLWFFSKLEMVAPPRKNDG
jgi:hypothetical protein